MAEYADGWNTFFMPLDAYAQKLEVLAGHCQRAGRDPETIRKQLVMQAVVSTNAQRLDDQMQTLVKARGGNPDAIRQRLVMGTPEQVVEQLLPYVEAGVDDFLIGCRVPYDYETLEVFAEKVAPVIRERAPEYLARRK